MVVELACMKYLLACCAIASCFYSAGQSWNPNADVDQDGCIGVGDVLEVLSLFGECQPAWQCGDSLEHDNYWYQTVQIDNQCWFAENLRTTRYANGDIIPEFSQQSEWDFANSLNAGARTVYGSTLDVCDDAWTSIAACDTSVALDEFGRLYNWYAVNDQRNICPSGWKVPTSDEFFLYADTAPYKTTSGWYGSGNGTNASGFSGKPSGYYYVSGYVNAGIGTYFWTSSTADSNTVYAVSLWWNSSTAGASLIQPTYANSVRCILETD